MKEVKLVTADTAVKKKKSTLFNICLIAGIVVVIAAVAVAIYKYLTLSRKLLKLQKLQPLSNHKKRHSLCGCLFFSLKN